MKNEGYPVRVPLLPLHTKEDWKTWLGVNFPELQSAHENSALLLACFTEGSKYVYDCLGKRLGIVPPVLGIMITEKGPSSSPVGCSNLGFLHYIKINYLIKMSELEMNLWTTIDAQNDGAAIFRGYLPDMFRLAGVEEMHHAVYIQRKRFSGSGPDPANYDLTSYDANELEYRALRWQIRYARLKNMPIQTASLLEDRYSNATLLRKILRSS